MEQERLQAAVRVFGICHGDENEVIRYCFLNY